MTWLQRLLDDAQPAAVRLAATVGLAWNLPAELPEDLVEAMVTAMTELTTDDELRRLGWCWDSIEVLGVDALGERVEPRVELVVGLARADRAKRRGMAVYLAGDLLNQWRSPSERLLPALATLLEDPDEEVRARAARQLADAHPEHATVADALAAALDDPAPAVADAAIDALTRLGDPRCLPALLAALRRPIPAPDELSERFELPGSMQLVLPGLARGPGLLERASRLLGPAHARHPDLLEAMRQQLRELPDSNALASILGRVGELGAAGAQLADEVVALLDRPRFQQSAIRVLGGMGLAAAPSSGPALRHLLLAPNPEVALAAAHTLWQLTGDQDVALPTLRRLLEHPLGRHRGEAAVALWRRTGQADPALAIIDAALRGQEPDLASALGARDWRLAPAHLLWSWLAELRGAAAPLAPPLRALLDRPDRQLRLTAAIALWQVAGDHTTAVPILRDAVATGPPMIGLRAIACLGEIGPLARPVAPLLRELLDRDRRYLDDVAYVNAGAVQADHAAQATIRTALHRILAMETAAQPLR